MPGRSRWFGRSFAVVMVVLVAAVGLLGCTNRSGGRTAALGSSTESDHMVVDGKALPNAWALAKPDGSFEATGLVVNTGTSPLAPQGDNRQMVRIVVPDVSAGAPVYHALPLMVAADAEIASGFGEDSRGRLVVADFSANDGLLVAHRIQYANGPVDPAIVNDTPDSDIGPGIVSAHSPVSSGIWLTLTTDSGVVSGVTAGTIGAGSASSVDGSSTGAQFDLGVPGQFAGAPISHVVRVHSTDPVLPSALGEDASSWASSVPVVVKKGQFVYVAR